MSTLIGVPYELYPSSLLWLDSLSQSGRDLRARCRDLGAVDPALLRQLAADAMALLAHGDANSCAMVLICLADRCREAGDLLRAREYCTQAEAFFCCYEDSRHVHNLAVSHYAHGLVCQAMGLPKDAVNSYDQALKVFKCASEEWLRVPECARRRMSQCKMVVHWIRKLRAGLVSDGSGRSTHVRIPVLSPTAAGDPVCAREEFDEWVSVEESVAGRANFALRVMGDSMTGAGIQDGDIVLIEQIATWPGDGQIVVVRIDGMESGSVIKRFYRRSDHICLQPANDVHPFLIVLPSWRLQEGIEKAYERSDPSRALRFFIDSSVSCVGWYRGKV